MEIRMKEVYEGELLGSTLVEWKWKKQDWANGETGLWCSLCGNLWEVSSGDVLPELSPIGVRELWHYAPRGLPWDGCVALLKAAPFRHISPHRGLTFEGCPPSSTCSNWGNSTSFLERNLGRATTVPITGIFQKNTMTEKTVGQG